jgi:hypothetical protein
MSFIVYICTMNKMLGLVKGFAERFTLTVLSFFPKVTAVTLQRVRDGLNTKDAGLTEAINGLKSSDPANLDSYTGLESILKWLKPLIYIAFFLLFAYFGFKIYKTYKN